jgi:uncharacterized membrane protein YkvA (DUF1232 family)
MRNIPRIRTLLFETPPNAMVAYSLLRDPRVPTAPKAALLGAFGFIVSPLNVPRWVPVLGQLDMLALSVLSINVFLDACPPELVREHQEAVHRSDSRFHHDARQFAEQARERAVDVANEAFDRWRTRRGHQRARHNGAAAS